MRTTSANEPRGDSLANPEDLRAQWQADLIDRLRAMERPRTGESANISAVWNDALVQAISAIKEAK
jgi:hypothetical protein